MIKKKFVLLFIGCIFLFLNFGIPKELELINLIPEIKGWQLVESPQTFLPNTLYEYINGGAEIYLMYDFKELVVAEFKNQEGASLIIEIYNMENEKNCFGIYSIERSPESNYLLIGNHGYINGESLNFIISSLYIKINCYDCGSDSKTYLLNFAKEIINKVKNRGKLPIVLNYFPQKGLIKNSEKFFLKNFLGLKFLHSGYEAEYNLNNKKFYLFIIEGKNEKDAQNMYQKLKVHFGKNNILEKININNEKGFALQDRFYKKILIIRIRNYILGSLKLEDLKLARELISSILIKIRNSK